MASAVRGSMAVIGVTLAALTLAACTGRPAAAHGAALSALPQRILHGPKSMLSTAEPQTDGTMWALAGPSSAGLFQISSATGRVKASFSVSDTARSVAESSTGTLALALGRGRSGALDLISSRARKVIRTVPLAEPARQVVVGSDGITFYVLTARAGTASVEIVNGTTGRVRGTVPVPGDAVSVVPDAQQDAIYALGRDGLVDQVSTADGMIQGEFRVGGAGRSIAISPDGSTLYALRERGRIANVAVVDTDTEAVTRVLPAPSNCVELMVSPGGGQLYDVVGTAGYGNIQLFAV